MKHLSDAELVARALNDQMQAFQELIDRYKKKIYYTARGVVGTHQDAEDVLQDVMLQALRSLKKLRQPEGFGPWIVRIAFNRSIDIKRKRKREVLPDNSDEGFDFFSSIRNENPGSDPERLLNSSDISTGIQKVVRDLPDSQKNAFLLKHIASLSIKEIAMAMNCTESTVKTNIYRAVQKLRDELSPLVKEKQTQIGVLGA